MDIEIIKKLGKIVSELLRDVNSNGMDSREVARNKQKVEGHLQLNIQFMHISNVEI